MTKIAFDNVAKKALESMEKNSTHIFLTGKAGTGKSTLLKYFLSTTQKNLAILAPTGVAALNVGGVTIHSFFGFAPTVTIKKAKQDAKYCLDQDQFTTLDALVIDEISMVRADLMDCIDVYLKEVRKSKKAFGGVQLIMIGDLYQLPPVVTTQEREFFQREYPSPFFFSANVMKQKDFKLEFIELEKVYRQSDQKFIDVLHAIRTNTLSTEHLKTLNARVVQEIGKLEEGNVYLAGTNAQVDKINHEYLSDLDTDLEIFQAKVKGEIKEKQFPTEINLSLKEGAQVMFVSNDPEGRRVNGTLGKVIKLTKEQIIVQIYEGDQVEVEPFSWRVTQYNYDSDTRKLTTSTIGSFTQIPLMLARAVTIHKSQGKTFDNVIIDLRSGIFAHGQAYVALSRCRSLEGIQLVGALSSSHIRLDYNIIKFLSQFTGETTEQLLSLSEKIYFLEKIIQQKGRVSMSYAKGDSNARRIFEPREVGKMEYEGRPFMGVKGFCHTSGGERVFSVEKILEIEVMV